VNDVDIVILDASKGPPLIKKLEEAAFPHPNMEGFFAFAFRKACRNAGQGWQLFDPREEYGRLGLTSGDFRLSTINEKYGMCDTYPKV